MKLDYKIICKIGALVFICGAVFFIITLYWYQDFSSIQEFLAFFFIQKNIFLLFCIALFSLGVGTIVSLFMKNIFSKIEENNTKLKDYNHFLAHELKTPISVMYSNLDVLSYGFDTKIVDASRKELKNMIHIIDGLLNFSESIKISEKKEINLENFLKNYTTFFDSQENISIHNTQFNFSIITDELLFSRVVKNLIDNALKYSSDTKLDIHIEKNKCIFINNIEKTLSQNELEKLQEKFFSKSFEEKKGHGIGIPMLEEIVKNLGYEMKIYSQKNKFIVEIIFEK